MKKSSKKGIVRYGTQEEYEKIFVPFRDNQRQRKNLREKARTFNELQIMYNRRKKVPVYVDTMYFIED